MPQALKIDIWSDVVCPWCLVGLERLDQALAAAADAVLADIEHHPFLLDPSTPEEGDSLPDMLRRKYGRDPREMWARVEGEARSSGLELDLSRQTMRYPTARAHVLIQAARPLGRQHQMERALADAYFFQARNINDPEVLMEIAVGQGFDAREAHVLLSDESARHAVALEAGQAARQGINGVPFFVFAEKFALSGSQPRAVFDRAIALAIGQEALPKEQAS